MRRGGACRVREIPELRALIARALHVNLKALLLGNLPWTLPGTHLRQSELPATLVAASSTIDQIAGSRLVSYRIVSYRFQSGELGHRGVASREQLVTHNLWQK